MSNLILTRNNNWQKPIRGSTLDTSNPLCPNKGYWLFNEYGGPPVNLLNKVPLITNGNPVWKGQTVAFDGSSDYYTDTTSPILYTDFTFILCARVFGWSGDNAALFGQEDYQKGCHLRRDGSSTSRFKCWCVNSSGNITVGTDEKTELALWALTRSGDKIEMHWLSLESKKQAYGTFNKLSQLSRANTMAFAAYYNGSTKTDCEITWASTESRGRTKEELVDLANNPYQFIKSPINRRVFSIAVIDNLTASVFDDVSVADYDEEILKLVRLKANVSESIGITESSTIPLTPLISQINEILTLLENLKVVISPSLKQAIESISVTEDIQALIKEATFNIATEENITLLENIVVSLKTLLYKVSISDSISIEDVANFSFGNLPGSIDVFDSVNVLDNIQTNLLTLLFKISESEDIEVSEAILTELLGAGDVNLSDNITVLENISVLLTDLLFHISQSESIAVTESITVKITTLLAQISSYELITLIENVTVELKAILLKVNNADNISVTDHPIIQFVDVSDLAANLYDIIGIIDRVFVALDSFRTSVYDTISATDFNNVALTPTNLLLSDVLAITEFIKIVFPLLKTSQSDSISLQEEIKVTLGNLASHSNETITILENLQLILNPLVNSSFETISLQDLLILSLYTQDRIDVHETISVTEGIFVSNRDTVSAYLRRYLGDVVTPGSPKQVQDIVDETIDSDLGTYLRRYLGDIK